MKRILAALAASAFLVLGLSAPALADAVHESTCTEVPGSPAVPATTKEITNPNYVSAVAAVPAVPAVAAVPAVPSLWWVWSPNKDQGEFDGPPAFPTDPRGTWQGPKDNGGPDGVGTFNTSKNDKGNASWFHREPGKAGTPGTPGTPAIPAKPAVGTPTITVPDQPAKPAVEAILCEWHTWDTNAYTPDAVNADQVNWPQTLVGPGQIAPEACGLTYQQDWLRGTRAQIDDVLDGDELTRGEDGNLIRGWVIISTDECIPTSEPHVYTETDNSSVCTEPLDGTVTVTTRERTVTVPQVWNTETKTFVDGEPSYGEWTVITDVQPTDECDAPTPTPTPTETTPVPTPTPTVVNSTCDDFTTQADAQAAYVAGATWLDGDGDGRACDSLTTPAPAPSVSQTPVAPVVQKSPPLAETGFNGLALAAGALVLVLAGTGLVLARRRQSVQR